MFARSITLCSLLANPGVAADIAIAPEQACGPAPRAVMDGYHPAKVKDETPEPVFFFGAAWRMRSKAGLKWPGHILAADGVILVAPTNGSPPRRSLPPSSKMAPTPGARVAVALPRSDRRARPLFVGGWSAGVSVTHIPIPDAFHRSLLNPLAEPGTPERNALEDFLRGNGM